jgi:hypothetical protein
MNRSCPQCGAGIGAGESTCLGRFTAAQLKEVENPDTYYTVHHLSVLSYLLQHNIYPRERWIELYRLLERFVREGLPPEEARRCLNEQVGGEQQDGSPVRGEKLPGVERIAWTRTIADVHDDTPEHYIADVGLWARAVLKDAEALVRSIEPEG